MTRNEALRVAFIHAEESSDGKGPKEFYSKLVKADIHGKDQVNSGFKFLVFRPLIFPHGLV